MRSSTSKALGIVVPAITNPFFADADRADIPALALPADVMADTACDSNWLRKAIAGKGAQAA